MSARNGWLLVGKSSVEVARGSGVRYDNSLPFLRGHTTAIQCQSITTDCETIAESTGRRKSRRNYHSHARVCGERISGVVFEVIKPLPRLELDLFRAAGHAAGHRRHDVVLRGSEELIDFRNGKIGPRKLDLSTIANDDAQLVLETVIRSVAEVGAQLRFGPKPHGVRPVRDGETVLQNVDRVRRTINQDRVCSIRQVEGERKLAMNHSRQDNLLVHEAPLS